MAAEKKHCNHCNREVETVEQVLSTGPHYARLVCADCGKFIVFLPKPKNKDKRPPNRFSPDDLKIHHCQLCLRHKSRLGGRGVLEVHHVQEINSGGKDVPENIWVLCTSCHRLVHHQRTYINVHQQGKYSFEDLRKDLDRDNVPYGVQQQLKRIYQLHEARNAERGY